MSVRVVSFLVVLLFSVPPAPADVAPDVAGKLEAAKYVYVSSKRKDGEFGTPAEIWFLWRDGSVYVGTSPSSWRVRRIRAGRSEARIAVGSVEGPSFDATGEIVEPPPADVLEDLYATFAKKYPDGWPTFEERFRKGFASGERVLVRYAPE